MTSIIPSIQDFLSLVPELQAVDLLTLKELSERVQPLRYGMGQVILRRETMPAQVLFLMEGQARLLGQVPKATSSDTLEILKPRAVMGWVSLIRNVPCERIISSIESTCLALEASDFLQFCDRNPAFKAAFTNKVGLIEVFDLLAAEMARRAQIPANLAQLARDALPGASVMTLTAGKMPLSKLDRDFVWLVSGSDHFGAAVGSRIESVNDNDFLEVSQEGNVRLIGLRDNFAVKVEVVKEMPVLTALDIPYAPELPKVGEITNPKGTDYPHFYGRGPVDASLACFQMLARYWQMPFYRHVVKRAIDSQFARSPKLSLQLCGAIAELMGLNGQLLSIPARLIAQVPTPALLPWQDTFAVLYKASDRELILGIPEQGIVTKKTSQFADLWGDSGQVLLVQPTKDTPQLKFGLSWFLPSKTEQKSKQR